MLWAPVDLAKIGWDPQTTLRLVAGPSASTPPEKV